MISASLQTNAAPTVRWGSCRNILLALIFLQMVALIYMGFSAPSVSHHLHDSISLPKPVAGAASNRRGSGGGTSSSTEQLQGESKSNNGGDIWKDVSKDNNKHLPSSTVINVGPYDIPGAYFANFELQRDRPKFRKVALPGDEESALAEGLVSKLLVEKNQPTVKSCHSVQQARRLIRKECQSSNNKLVAYNSHSTLERTWCGTSLKPGEVKVVTCTSPDESVRLYPHDSPPVNGEGMPTIQFIRNEASAPLEELQNCPIPCQVTMDTCQDRWAKGTGKGIDCLPSVSDWTIGGTDWKFKFYHKHPGKKVDRKAYRQFHFSASESFQSDVPLSNFEFSILEAPPAVAFDAAAQSVSFIETSACNGVTSGIRASAWASVMNEKVALASYSHCEHNTDLPEGLSLSNKEHRQILFKKHLFTLIVEPSLENDFIDGLVWEALHAGVIPVYYGASNLNEHVPPNSVVFGNAIGNKADTAARVVEIMNNRTLWETYHAWRKEPFPERLKQKFEFLKTDAYCRVCKWSYAKRYGLGWNHEYQMIEEPLISSRSESMCVSNDGFLVRPFRETWFAAAKPDESAKTAALTNCEDKDRTQTIQSDLFTVRRTLSNHDSVVDIVVPEIESSNEGGDIVLRLEVPIHNWEGAHFRDVHQLFDSKHLSIYSSVAIQDRKSRLTIITNWQTQIRCPTHGTVEIVVQDASEQTLPTGEIRKIRVILEDTSTLRDVMTEYGTSPFAKPLIEDFLDPLEMFYIQ